MLHLIFILGCNNLWSRFHAVPRLWCHHSTHFLHANMHRHRKLFSTAGWTLFQTAVCEEAVPLPIGKFLECLGVRRCNLVQHIGQILSKITAKVLTWFADKTNSGFSSSTHIFPWGGGGTEQFFVPHQSWKASSTGSTQILSQAASSTFKSSTSRSTLIYAIVDFKVLWFTYFIISQVFHSRYHVYK